MTGPISTALAGADYRGAFGGTGGDISRVVQQFAEAAKADKLAKDKQALEASLRAQDQEWKQREFDQSANQFTTTYTAGQDKIRADRNQHEADQKQRDDEFKQQLEATIANRDSLDQDRNATRELSRVIAERTAGQRDQSLNLRERRFAAQLEGFTVQYTKDGQPQYINKYTGIAEPVMETDDGYGGKIWLPRSVVEGKGHMTNGGNPNPTPTPGAAPSPAPAPSPTPSGPGPTVAPTGEPAAPVQTGEKSVDVAAHAAPQTPAAPAFKPAQGTSAIPSNPERNGQAAYDALKGQIGIYVRALEGVHYKAPSLLTGIELAASDTPKSSIPGVNLVGAALRGIGNTAVGATDPKYQLVHNGIQAVGAQFIKLMSGLVANENEAQRLFNTVGMNVGDTPEATKQKLEQLDVIIKSYHQLAGRAAPKGSLTDSIGGGGTPAAAAGAPTAGARKWKLADGTVVDLPE